MFPPGLEPGTFRVLGERDNHYTTETPDGRYHSSDPILNNSINLEFYLYVKEGYKAQITNQIFRSYPT